MRTVVFLTIVFLVLLAGCRKSAEEIKKDKMAAEQAVVASIESKNSEIFNEQKVALWQEDEIFVVHDIQVVQDTGLYRVIVSRKKDKSLFSAISSKKLDNGSEVKLMLMRILYSERSGNYKDFIFVK